MPQIAYCPAESDAMSDGVERTEEHNVRAFAT